MYKRVGISILLMITVLFSLYITPAFAATDEGEYNAVTVAKIMDKTNIFALKAKSHILIDAVTGTTLIEGNSHDKLPIASVTKIMSMLLIMEAIDSGKLAYTDKVITSEHAVSMGGSQVYLRQGEVFTVNELLKAVAVHSANDATVALAEKVSGSEDAFVAIMNKRAGELGMKDTNFLDCSGLTDEGHYSSANDVAVMSRELIINHPKITEYTSIWLDKFRDGKFELNNTNKLVKYYDGCNGLKTGFTSRSGYCLSASAKKNNMLLISVVLGEADSNVRFAETKKLLDYGFANFETTQVNTSGDEAGIVDVQKGIQTKLKGIIGSDVKLLVNKGDKNKIKKEIIWQDVVVAPVKEGQKIGEAIYRIGDKVIGRVDIIAQSSIQRASFIRLFYRMFSKWLGMGKV